MLICHVPKIFIFGYMNLHDLFVKPYEAYETYQIILAFTATFFGVLSVYFSIKKNIWVYPTGIISTALYVYILFKFGLLGDMLINFYYTVMSIYGWFLWAKHAEDNIHVSVSRTTRKEWIVCIVLFVVSLLLVTAVYYYKPLLDTQLSAEKVILGLDHLDWANWLDVLTTAIFLVGMWLMAKRRVENWIFWIVGDLICIPMMLYKGLGITSVQYLVFTGMAILGYIEWKKSLK